MDIVFCTYVAMWSVVSQYSNNWLLFLGKVPVTEHSNFVCQPYKGTRCQKYVGNKTVYIPSNLTQKLIEEKINTAFTVIENSR